MTPQQRMPSQEWIITQPMMQPIKMEPTQPMMSAPMTEPKIITVNVRKQ